MEAVAVNYQSNTYSSSSAKKSVFISTILLLLVQFIGAFLGLEIVSILGIALISFYIAFKYRKGWYGIIIIGISLLVFQNLIIGIGAHLGKNTSSNLSFLTQVGTVFLFINALYVVINNKLNKALFYSVFLIGILSVLLVLGKAPFMSKLVYFRNFTLAPFIFILCYKHLVFKDVHSKEFKYFLKMFLNISLIVFIFGIIMYFLPYKYWKAIGINEVYIAKGDTTIEDGFNGRFTTGFVNGVGIFRMASLYYEPVNLGYFFVFSFIIALIYKKYFDPKKKRYLVFNGIGLVLTFGKGAYLLLLTLFLSAIVYWALFGYKKKTPKKVAISNLIVFGMLFGALWVYYKRIGGAASPHFWGIEATSKTIMSNPFGFGLGSGGNFGADGMDFSTGAETGLLSMIYQIGIPIFLLVLILYFMIIKNACETGIKMLAFVPLALLFVSIFQENTFTPQCLVPILSLCSMRFINKEGVSK